MNGFRFDAPEVRERAVRRLLQAPPAGYRRSDDDLNPDGRFVPLGHPPTPASVLVPIVAHAPETTVLMTLRTDTLPSHAGQVAFPGGKIAADDADALAAALRETEEETGLEACRIEPIGYLDAYLTRTNYRVVPVVALVEPGFILRPQVGEVAAVFEVPLRFLMTAENHLVHAREWQGSLRRFYAMPYGERYIWGATAGMLKSLYDRMYGEDVTP